MVCTGSAFITDLSDPLTAREARTALDRALDGHDQMAMAAWARQYGVAALEAVESLAEKLRDRSSW